MIMAESRMPPNTGLSPGMADLPGRGAPQTRRNASDADRQAFEQALAGGQETAATPSTQSDPPKRLPLFSGMAHIADAEADYLQDLSSLLPDASGRSLRGDDSDGRGESRLGLKDETLKSSGAPQTRREAADSDRQGADQGLAGGQAGAAASAVQPDLPKPFFLFSETARLGDSGGGVPQGLSSQLAIAADRLLVGDGSHGRREVRIDLKADVLPGVAVSIYEEAACLVVEFYCTRESSRKALTRFAQELADELAGSLSRSTLVRVRTDAPDDLCPFEAAGAAG